MTTPKQKTVNEPKTVRAVVPAAEAQVRLINASIEMLREYPFDQVTAREITKRAGLALTTISRNFGSMTGLFNQVSKALMDSALTRQSTPTQLTMFRDPDFILRSRLIAWMIAEGVDPKIFNTRSAGVFAPEFDVGTDIRSHRTTVAWQLITQFAGQGHAIFSEVRGVTKAQLADCIKILETQQDKLAEIERELGWAD